MKKHYKIVSLFLMIALLTSCVTGCAKNNLLSVYLGTADHSLTNESTENNKSTKDKVDERNDEKRLENSKVEVSSIAEESDKARVNSLTLEELDSICNIKNNLLNNLKIEFSYNRVYATVSLKDGCSSLNIKDLFIEDEATLSGNGEKILSAFLQIYTYVIYHTNYKDAVSGITLEYRAGAEESTALAQQRFNSIKDFTLSSQKSGIDAKFDEKFKGMFRSNFYAYDGTEENKNGSVVFRLSIDLDRIME